MEPFNPYKKPTKKRKPKKRGPKPKPKRPPKKRGPKRKPRRFEEVPLGHTLRLLAPLEFDLILQVIGPNGIPDADLIESISYSSTNPFFRTERFRLLLIKYRKEGCYAEHPKAPPSPTLISRSISMRANMIKAQSDKN